MRALWAVVLCVGCGEVKPLEPDAGATQPDDAAPVVRSCAGRPFGAPEPVAGVNTLEPEESLRLSSDELTAYFSRGGQAYTATRANTNQAFGTATPLQFPGASEGALSLTITGDGTTLYFTSQRNGSLGGLDLWRAQRASPTAAFGTPVNVSSLNSSSAENDASVTPDGSTLYFTSARSTTASIYRADLRAAPPQPRLVLATPGLIYSRAVVNGDGKTLFYQAENEIEELVLKPDGTAAGRGIAHAELNSTLQDHPTWLSADGCRLYFQSDRVGGAGAMDVYVAVREPG